MPKNQIPQDRQDTIIQMPLEEVMPNSIMPYAEHVILDRALPRVEDGLKPVQRRILFTMNELGLTPDKPHRKCARIVGDCLGKYHPHGDSSVYDALVRMAQPYSLRGVLVDGHGNFGSIDGDSAAAMRYTEARMAPLAMEMLRDIEKDTVSFQLNFDDTLKEPELLPARFPNLLVNGSSGIAVGLATNIPPHNLREAVEAACLLIDHPDASTDDLMKVMPAPDFPTGGVLLDTPELKTAYETGKGKLTLRARVSVEKGSAGRTLLVITEVPYGVSKAQMLEKILKLSEEKKAQLSCIYDIRDESDRTGLRAVVELKKDANVERTLAILYKYSDLQITFGVNLFAIANGKPELMGIRQALMYYLEHQKKVVTRRTRYELDQARARAHILEGLIVAVDHLDEVIALIRASKSGKEAKQRLMERFGFTDVQAQAILDLRLQRLTGLEILALRKEYEEILKTIATLEGILKSEKKLMAVIQKEMREIARKYGDDRRTTLLREEPREEPVIEKEEAPAEPRIVALTRAGLLKRFDLRTFDKLDLADGPDKLSRLCRTDTLSTLLIFTDLGNCFQLPVKALQDSRPKDRGVSLNGLLSGLETAEKAVGLFSFRKDEKLPGFFTAVTRFGMVKRTPAEEYQIRRARFAGIRLKDDDRLQNVLLLNGDEHLLLITLRGRALRFPLSQVEPTGRTSAGVKGISKAEKDNPVLWSGVIGNRDEVLLISELGYGKAVPGVMFDPRARGGMGAVCMPFPKNGAVGSRLGGAAIISARTDVDICQSDRVTTLSSALFPVLSLNDRGNPLVVAVLGDDVTDLLTVPGREEITQA